jgi:hypothetical protein
MLISHGYTHKRDCSPTKPVAAAWHAGVFGKDDFWPVYGSGLLLAAQKSGKSLGLPFLGCKQKALFPGPSA